MADITPLTDGTGWNGKDRRSLFYDAPATSTPLTTTNKLKRHYAYGHRAFYFSSIDSGDDITTHRGVVACAWQANSTGDTGAVMVNSTQSIRFLAGSNNKAGWIHLIHGGSSKSSASNTETAAAKGAAGYVPTGWIYANHKNASPDTVTSGRRVGAHGLTFEIFPFTLSGAASDRWKSESDKLCPRIISVAWQANEPQFVAEDRVAVTLDASGDVIFTPESAAAGTGWLWCWRRAV